MEGMETFINTFPFLNDEDNNDILKIIQRCPNSKCPLPMQYRYFTFQYQPVPSQLPMIYTSLAVTSSCRPEALEQNHCFLLEPEIKPDIHFLADIGLISISDRNSRITNSCGQHTTQAEGLGSAPEPDLGIVCPVTPQTTHLLH